MAFAWTWSADALFDGLCFCHEMEKRFQKSARIKTCFTESEFSTKQLRNFKFKLKLKREESVILKK